MKKKLALLAACAACLFLFCACSAKVSTGFSANWLKDPSAMNNPSFYEELTYGVSFSSSDSKDTVGKIQVDAENSGLVMKTEALASWTHPVDGTIYYGVYRMSYELTLSATYYYIASDGSEEKVLSFGGASDTADVDYDDPAKIVSEIIFYTLADQKNLQPVYNTTSYFTYNTQMSGSRVSLYSYSTVIDYGTDCSQAKISWTDHFADLSDDELSVSDNLTKVRLRNTDSATIKDLQKNYTFIDASQLLFAARGLNYSAQSSNTVATVLPGISAQPLNATLSCSEIIDNKFTFSFDGQEAAEQNISCANVSIALSGNGSNNGASHEMLIAQRASETRSDYYAIPMRIESPFGFSGMTTIYTIKSASHTKA